MWTHMRQYKLDVSVSECIYCAHLLQLEGPTSFWAQMPVTVTCRLKVQVQVHDVDLRAPKS